MDKHFFVKSSIPSICAICGRPDDHPWHKESPDYSELETETSADLLYKIQEREARIYELVAALRNKVIALDFLEEMKDTMQIHYQDGEGMWRIETVNGDVFWGDTVLEVLSEAKRFYAKGGNS